MSQPRAEESRGESRGIDTIFFVQLAIVALSVTGAQAVRPMVTYRALGLGAGPLEVGIIAAIFSIAPALLAVGIGRLVDRSGEAWFIRVALVGVTVGALIAALANSLVLLAVSQSITGLGHVANLIAGQALVANRGGRAGREHRYGYYSTMGSLGHLAGPLLATFLVTNFGSVGDEARVFDNPQAPAFLAAASASAIAFALAWLLPLRRPSPQTSDEGRRVGLLRAAGAVLKRPGMPFAMLVSMIVISSIDVLIAYLPLYGETRGIAVGTVGVLLAIRAGSSMVSRLLMGYLIARLGRNLLLGISMGSAALALATLPMLESTLALGMAMVVIGLGLGIGQPMTTAWVANRSPRAERATALGVRLTGNRTALVIMPVVVGAVAGATGVGVIFWLVASLLGAGAMIGLRAPLDTPPPPRPVDAEAVR